MRIIAGKWRSRRLLRPRGENTRPMPDRVKEAVFSILGSHFDSPGVLPALHVGDVFAGSGSMGLEALSRGAASCCFFERDHQALISLRRNIETLQAQEASTIVTRDAWRSGAAKTGGSPFDLILLDPPYRDSQDTTDAGAVRRYLARVEQIDSGKPLVVLHHSATVSYGPENVDRWQVVDRRTFGTNSITIFAP